MTNSHSLRRASVFCGRLSRFALAGGGRFMKVILKKPVKDLGDAGAVVEVNDGYGRNFLLPKGLALEATAGNLNALRQQEHKASQSAARAHEAAKELAARVNGRTVTVSVRAGQAGRLFGSITAQDLADAFKSQLGATVDKRRILLDEPIKSTGLYQVQLRLHPQVTASVAVNVVEA